MSLKYIQLRQFKIIQNLCLILSPNIGTHQNQSYNLMEQNNKRPVTLIIDIDGVIIQHKQPLPTAKESIEKLQSIGQPFVFFTNNTAKTEKAKADQLTQLMGLSTPISADQIILNYTPIKKTFQSWHDKLVLFIGREQINDMLPFEEIPHYITIEEYCTVFPEISPFNKRPAEKTSATRELIKQRLGLPDSHFTMFDLKFDLIFTLNCPVRWEECIQVVLDLLSSDDGRVCKAGEYIYHKNQIPIYSALNDLWFRNKHSLPRLLLKPFNLALEAVYQQIYKQPLKITHFGKPQRASFQYVHNHVDRLYGPSQEYVMIGDNIDTDIEGAYNYGWKSVLVQSGVSKHTTEKANHTCNSILEAVNWALETYNK